jgi:uracil-DNA glycosylase
MILNKVWDELAGKEFQQPYLQALMNGIRNAREKGKIIYPEKGKAFTAFNHCDYNEVKVVILGQDPYPSSNADGIAFNWGNPVQEKMPQAYRQIMQTINTQVYPGQEKELQNDFVNWAMQGVFLLNTVLTVTKGEPLSHAGKGWETFTMKVFMAICQLKKPIVYLLWGSYARQYKQFVKSSSHLVIECEHPTAPYHDGRTEWNNNDCFNKCNDFLIQRGERPIEWNQELPF